ncbi:uncharacterized protein LY89DRAFT_379002 [Mollisia scopiformis]|uniref:Uncharacterized protein n=1 Tax=Mollisia scopiformis TaxID=149040 RepID=A0A194XND4_MOLSC|nr:uncharacterized protein LY89DRAFT_379002 [Mollisia scopiformis]KUJ21614.1 hypothetical protein LY89DRAFT_379002 [Mollisia scopiformis]
MATTYTIQIFNSSNINRSYSLFQSVPTPQNSPDCFTNVYQRSPMIVSGNSSYCTFSMQKTFYAIYGTSPKTLSAGVTVTSCNSAPITLSSNDGTPPASSGTQLALSTIEKNGKDPMWGAPSMTQGTLPNSYGISCDSSFSYPNSSNICIGFGATDPHTGQVIPVATIPAIPGTDFFFEPKNTYYIAAGSWALGTVVNVAALSTTLTVDFTQISMHDAIFTHCADGSWKVGPPRS